MNARRCLGVLRTSLLALFVAALCIAHGCPAHALTLRDAVGGALENHPSVAAAEAERAQARAAAGIASAAWLPTLSVAGSLTRYEEPMLVFPIHRLDFLHLPTFDETLIQGGVTASYTLFEGAGRIGRIRQACAAERAATFAGEAVEQGVIAQVTRAYLQALHQSEVLAAHDARLLALQAEKKRVQDLWSVGRAAQIQILQTEAAIANAEADRVAIAGALELAQRELARLTGLPVDSAQADRLEDFTIVDSLPASSDELLSQALAANPQVEESRARVRAADAGVGVARSERWPELNALGSYLAYADGSGEDTYEWNVGLRLAWPLFTGGAVGKGVERARATRAGTQAGLALAELQVRDELDRAWNAHAEARARMASLEAAVAATGEVVRIQQLLVQTGAGTESDYLNAEADLLEARAALSNARHGALGAQVELARVSGRLSREWIDLHIGERKR